MKKLTKILLTILTLGIFGGITLGSLYGSTYIMRDGSSAYKYLVDEECSKRESDALISRIETSASEFTPELDNLKIEFANLQFNQVAREARNVEINDSGAVVFNNATIIETSVSNDPSYNVMRCYSSTSWTAINTDNTVMIGRTVSQKLYELTRRTYEVGNFLTVTYKGTTVDLQIVGIYEDNLTSGEHNKWRTIGNYFEKAFNECLFVSQNTFKQFKTNSAIALFTASSQENGNRLTMLTKYAKKNNWSITMDVVDATSNTLMNQKIAAINAYFDSKKRMILNAVIIFGLIALTITDFVLAYKISNSIPIENIGNGLLSKKPYLESFINSIKRVFLLLYVFIPVLVSLAEILVFRRKVRILQEYVRVPLSNPIAISTIFIFALFVSTALFASKFKEFIRLFNEKDKINFGDKDSKRDLHIEQEFNDDGTPKKRVVFVSLNNGNKNSATTLRDIQLGSVFKKMNYQVIYVNFGDTPFKQFVKTDYGTVVSLKKYPRPNIIGKVLNHIDLSNTVSEFVCYQIKTADVVIVSPCISEKGINHIYKTLSKHNSKFILAVTERYSIEEFGKATLMTKENIKFNNYCVDEFNNKEFSVICISKFLQNIYEERGFKTIRIPFIFEKSFYPLQEENEHFTTNFMYSGIPFKKDSLALSLEGFALLPEERLPEIRIHLVGVTEEWVKANIKPESFAKIENSLICYGVQSHEFVVEKFKEIDFTFLMRDPALDFTKAGFPTKVSESLHNATPVISNITSDLGDYLENGVNSFVVDDYSPEAFEKAIENAIKLNKKKLQTMKERAYKTAQEKLSLEAFEEEFVKFVNED